MIFFFNSFWSAFTIAGKNQGETLGYQTLGQNYTHIVNTANTY
jgi:hypothetical protein